MSVVKKRDINSKMANGVARNQTTNVQNKKKKSSLLIKPTEEKEQNSVSLVVAALQFIFLMKGGVVIEIKTYVQLE